MNVSIKFGAPLSVVVGQDKIVLSLQDGATVDDLLMELRKCYPDFEEGVRGKSLPKMWATPFYRMIVNADMVPWDRSGFTSLHDGDHVYFMLPYDGG
ncbi:MAG TPA: MoaD/ThiS family protein [Longilinea sp.]|nr:MoaD/ThiS family protein [Longilinea sp.]